MNKIKYLFFAGMLASAGVLTSCDKDEPEIEYASKLAGDYEGSEVCDGDKVGPYEVHVYNTASESDKVWVENIWDYAPKVKATVTSDNSFTIDPQTVIHKGATPAGNDTFNIVSGTGTIND